jgi:hypothetical protein
MSEYQYFEFQAIDRQLDDKELRMLRQLSTRAEITPTSFVNTYNYGSFKGDPTALMSKFFDAHVYVTNWGTRRLMLRLPRRALDMPAVAACCTGESASLLRAGGDQIVLSFTRKDEEGANWEDGEGWLSSLVPLRADLLRGDLRVMYLAWLMCAQRDELDDEEREPTVPPGLGKLSAPLSRFVEFFGIDPVLLEVAAVGSKPAAPAPAREVAAWIGALPEKEKNDLLLRLIRGAPPDLGCELRRRFDEERTARSSSGGAQRRAPVARTVRQLLASAEDRSHRQKGKRRGGRPAPEEVAR